MNSKFEANKAPSNRIKQTTFYHGQTLSQPEFQGKIGSVGDLNFRTTGDYAIQYQRLLCGFNGITKLTTHLVEADRFCVQHGERVRPLGHPEPEFALLVRHVNLPKGWAADRDREGKTLELLHVGSLDRSLDEFAGLEAEIQ